MSTHWNQDHTLNIFVLGPMADKGAMDSSCGQIKTALDHLLTEPDTQKLLQAFGSPQVEVRIPDALTGNDIINDVLHHIDTADLVIVNLTPKDMSGQANGAVGGFSPNVFYELGIVHSLGLPYLLLRQEGTPLPFYFRSTRVPPLASFATEELEKALRPALREFLNSSSSSNFRDNRVSDFYGKIPIVDVSAVTGLATAYYLNFIERALREGGFITHYPDRLRHLIVCRPRNIFHTFEEDHAALKKHLHGQLGLTLLRDTLNSKNDADRRSLGADFVQDVSTEMLHDVVVDLPTTAYTLVKSPRFHSLANRIRASSPGLRDWHQHPLLLQHSQQLLDTFDTTIRYLMTVDDRARLSAISFTTIEGLPQRLKELGVA